MPRPADRTTEGSGRDGTAGERSESRSAIGRFLLAGLVALVVVGTPAAFWTWPVEVSSDLMGGGRGTGLIARQAGPEAGPGNWFDPAAAPVFLLSLAVLQLAQLVLVVGLARRMRSGQIARPPRRNVDASGLERRRIARDLHDDVIQDLAGLSYAMESEVTRGTSAQLPFFTRALAVLQQSVRTLRAMTTELYPLDLDRLGLPLALARLADPLRAQGIDVRLSLPDHCELGREHSAVLYRVAREIVANVLKHAEARTVEFSLGLEADHALLRISDDGRGFDPAAGAPEGHLGLRIMRDTMFEAGGGFDISSRPGGGTVVSASLPGSGQGAE